MTLLAIAREEAPAPTLRTARVVAADDDRLTLDDGSRADIALSCFIRPEVGDSVLCVDTERCYVTHVLRRGSTLRTARVALPGIERLAVTARSIALTATQKLELTSAVDCEILAATGTLSLSAQHLVSHAVATAFQLAREVVVRAENIQQMASHLLSTRARRQLLVADKEVRVDGELIQMG